MRIKSFSKSYDNSYTKVCTRDIKSHFTCDESSLCYNSAKLQNMEKNVAEALVNEAFHIISLSK